MKSASIHVVEPGCRKKRGAIQCIEGRHVEFDSTGLESYFFRSDWNPDLYDLLLLAGAVEFCDRTIRRPAMDWSREFNLTVPVHEPNRWNHNTVLSPLRRALQFLTGDHWALRFVQRHAPKEAPRQGLLSLCESFSGVLPFSNGLDSLAVSGVLKVTHGLSLVRVRLGTIPGGAPHPGKIDQPFVALPYDVHPDAHDPESSSRHRGFKFAILCGIAAHLAGCGSVYLTESGQGALGPSLVNVGQGYPDYRSHPRFLRMVEGFLSGLLSSSPQFITPRIWKTKGETLSEFASLEPHALRHMHSTRSCWMGQRLVGYGDGQPLRQCGVCAACMLRRMSLHVACATENQGAYVWEDLSVADFDSACDPGFPAKKRNWKCFHEYAIAGALHLDHLAELADPRYESQLRNEAFHLSLALGEPEDVVFANLHGLLQRHSDEWNSFLRSLGSTSFVHQMIGKRP